MEMRSMRDALGEVLVELAEKDERIIALTANLGESTGLKAFREKFPDRFFDIGVSEQNLVTVASGLAAVGKIPFITSYAAFSPGRNWEQIKTAIALNNVPVKIIGNHAGLSAAVYGATHMGMEDIALMRSLPNCQVFSPCDAVELKKLIRAVAFDGKPVYIRLPRGETPTITNKDTPFGVGKIHVLREDSDPQVTVFGTGPILAEALLVETPVVVGNVHTIKPLDEQTVLHYAKLTGAVVTVEEHQLAGGLGGAVAEVLAQNYPTPMEMVGVKDAFGESGTYQELLDKHGLNKEEISRAVVKVLARKHGA